MTRVYLDYNASTPLDPRVADEFSRALQLYGNPSSIHGEGREARALVDEARVRLARLLNCDHRRLLFTSGGTEANNLAILGVARANREKGNHIITSAIEHSSVMNACRQLQQEGFDITSVSPTRDGLITVDAIEKVLRKDTILISIMMANNEIGTLQPIAEIAQQAHRSGILMHTDAIQAAGKIAIDIKTLQVDLLSVSAHKMYGPKGAGALYHSESAELQPLLRGGTHEGGLRAGTENVAGIHAFGVAAELLNQDGLPQLRPLQEKLESKLRNSVKILCEDAPRLPNTINFYSDAWLGESMVMALDLEGIAVSNGSACASGIIEPSHVILALGYNEDIATSVIRVSFGKFTREEELDTFAEVIQKIHSRVAL